MPFMFYFASFDAFMFVDLSLDYRAPEGDPPTAPGSGHLHKVPAGVFWTNHSGTNNSWNSSKSKKNDWIWFSTCCCQQEALEPKTQARACVCVCARARPPIPTVQ